MDSATKALNCKTKCFINMKPDPSILDVVNLILLSNLSKSWTMVCKPEPYHFHWNPLSKEYLNKTELCKCSFSARPYYQVQRVLSCKNNAAATVSLFSTYYLFNKILFNYLKVYHQISPEPEVEQLLMLITSDITLYDLSGLKIKIPDRPLSRCILGRYSGPIYSEFEQTLNIHV